MTSSCGQSSLGELKARLAGGAFTTALRHERGVCSTHFDVFFVVQPGAVEKKGESSTKVLRRANRRQMFCGGQIVDKGFAKGESPCPSGGE
jgi:hypothetical protein